MDPGSSSIVVTVTDGHGRAVADGGLARWLVRLAPARLRGELAIALVTDRRIRTLNRQYRGKDYATDVLSFPAEDFRLKAEATPSSGRSVASGFSRKAAVGPRTAARSGDIVIATGVARRQARQRGHSYATELRVLALHGFLHLLGYDHDDPEDHGRMARAEARLRRRGGLREGLISRAGARRRGPTRPQAMTPVLLLLLAVAAVYVGTIETAFSTLMRLSLRLMAERGGRDDRLGYYFDDPIRLFVPARLILGIIFSLATMAIAILTGRTGTLQSIGMLLLFVAVFILICEHVIPMFIVRRDPERVLEVLLPPFDVAARFVQPLTRALVGLVVDARRDRLAAAAVVANGGTEDASEAPGADETTAQDKRRMEGDERRLLQSIVDFGDTVVREVMTPRPDIVAIEDTATVGQLRALFREQEYSRIPVYRDNLDNILGVVFVKDLIRQTTDNDDGAGIQPLLRPGTFVPETKRVSALLKEFQVKQVQLAIVVDEYGGTAGLVTLEDLLEEIVGEIRDEYDVESEPVVDEGQGTYVFSGKASFDEVRDRLHVEIEPEGFETVGGYVLTRVGRVPAAGETFELDGLVVEVVEAERRRIQRVKIRRAAPVASVEAE